MKTARAPGLFGLGLGLGESECPDLPAPVTLSPLHPVTLGPPLDRRSVFFGQAHGNATIETFGRRVRDTTGTQENALQRLSCTQKKGRLNKEERRLCPEETDSLTPPRIFILGTMVQICPRHFSEFRTLYRLSRFLRRRDTRQSMDMAACVETPWAGDVINYRDTKRRHLLVFDDRSCRVCHVMSSCILPVWSRIRRG